MTQKRVLLQVVNRVRKPCISGVFSCFPYWQIIMNTSCPQNYNEQCWTKNLCKLELLKLKWIEMH